MTENALTEKYQSLIAATELKPDEAQAYAVSKMAVLFDRLSQGEIPMLKKKGFIARLFGGAEQASSDLGFYFYGDVGRGKSMVMDLFYELLPLQQKRRVHFHAFMLELHEFLHQQRQMRKKSDRQGEEVTADILKFVDQLTDQVQVLCFDEFQVTDVADAMLLGRLFTAFFARNMVVIITSNIQPDDLYLGGLQRDRFLPFIALLKQKTTVISFNGDIDYRLTKLREMGTYFHPHNAENQNIVEAEFQECIHGAEEESHVFHVKGREIHVPRAARDVAWFSFDQLCGDAKSATDYLEIAHHFRTVFIVDVPKITDQIRNEGKRFITAIDVFYENHTRVIISAATAPEELHEGRENAFAFDRTVSRLLEMQSKSYWFARP